MAAIPSPTRDRSAPQGLGRFMLASERRFDDDDAAIGDRGSAFLCADEIDCRMRIGTSNGVAPVTPAFMSSDKGLSKLSA